MTNNTAPLPVLTALFDDVMAALDTSVPDAAYVSISASWQQPGQPLISLTFSAGRSDVDDLDDDEESDA